MDFVQRRRQIFIAGISRCFRAAAAARHASARGDCGGCGAERAAAGGVCLADRHADDLFGVNRAVGAMSAGGRSRSDGCMSKSMYGENKLENEGKLRMASSANLSAVGEWKASMEGVGIEEYNGD